MRISASESEALILSWKRLEGTLLVRKWRCSSILGSCIQVRDEIAGDWHPWYQSIVMK